MRRSSVVMVVSKASIFDQAYLFMASIKCDHYVLFLLLFCRAVTRPSVDGTDSKNYETHRCARPRSVCVVITPLLCHLLCLFVLGLLCDLLWADPDKETMGWGENDRGVSFTFGPEIVTKFLHKHDLDLICRAHQVYYHNLILSVHGTKLLCSCHTW